MKRRLILFWAWKKLFNIFDLFINQIIKYAKFGEMYKGRNIFKVRECLHGYKWKGSIQECLFFKDYKIVHEVDEKRKILHYN